MLKSLLKDKSVLVVTAHYDDLEIAMSGLISDINKDTEIKVICLEDLSNLDKSLENKKIYLENCKKMNVVPESLGQYIYYITPTCYKENYKFIKTVLAIHFEQLDPEYVFIHSGSKNEHHSDHIFLNKLCKEILRPLEDNNLKGIIEFEVPGNQSPDFEYYNYRYPLQYPVNIERNKMLNKYPKIHGLSKDRRGLHYINKYNMLAATYFSINGESIYGAEQYKLEIFR